MPMLGLHQGISRAITDIKGGISFDGFLVADDGNDMIYKVDSQGNAALWATPDSGWVVYGHCVAHDGSGRVLALVDDSTGGAGVRAFLYGEGAAFEATAPTPTIIATYANIYRDIGIWWDHANGLWVICATQSGAGDGLSTILDESPYTFTNLIGTPDRINSQGHPPTNQHFVYNRYDPTYPNDLLVQTIGDYSPPPVGIGTTGNFIQGWDGTMCVIPSTAPNMGGGKYVLSASAGSSGRVALHNRDTGVETFLWSALSDSCSPRGVWYDPITELCYISVKMNSGNTYNGILAFEPRTTTFDILDCTLFASMNSLTGWTGGGSSTFHNIRPIYSGDSLYDSGIFDDA